MRELILDVWPALAHKLPPEDAAPSVKTAAHPARTGRRAFAPGSAGMTFASVLGIEIASTRALKLAASAARLRPHLGFAEFGVCRLQRGGVSIRRVGHRRHDLGVGQNHRSSGGPKRESSSRMRPVTLPSAMSSRVSGFGTASNSVVDETAPPFASALLLHKGDTRNLKC
jgi:hypothetical protein